MQDKTIISLTAIIAVTLLQIVAWQCGHNGQVFALTSAIIGGVTGFSIRDIITKKKDEWINGDTNNKQE